MSEPRLQANLESPLPGSLPSGTATALFCSGTAWEDGGPVQELTLLVGGRPEPPAAFRMPRFDMPVRRSGFWGVVPVVAEDSGRVELAVTVRTADGVCEQRPLGRIEAAVPDQAGAPVGEWEQLAPDAQIAICMATFEPDPELLEAQLHSIRSQTDRAWVCVVSDDCSSEAGFARVRELVGEDERFHVSRAPERIGFYRNFERAMLLAPSEARLIALCDQDDVWHPRKLSVLRAALGRSSLAYSDLRLVARDGRLLRDTLWQGRRNNWKNLSSMLFANTITGPSALFRREVAELALPFPESPGIDFHDHWIATVALACGEISYVEQPLYDYVQHDQAVLGKVGGVPGGARGGRRAWPRPRALPRPRAWRAAYFLGWIPTEVRSRTLLLRCGERLTPAKRRALERHLRADRSLPALLWLLARPLRALWGRNETLRAEWELAVGVLWRRIAELVARIPGLPDKWLLDTSFPDPPHFEYRALRRWRSRVYDQRL